jgi:hypothetical protein
MTVRPPTLREKRRYVLAEILPAGFVPDQKELYFAVPKRQLPSGRFRLRPCPARGHLPSSRVCDHPAAGGDGARACLALSTVTACGGEPLALRLLQHPGPSRRCGNASAAGRGMHRQMPGSRTATFLRPGPARLFIVTVRRLM